MIVLEVFDTKLDLKWQTTSRFELASFKYKHAEFLIQIEKKLLPFKELKGKKTAEISFSRNDVQDVEKSHSTIGDVEFPSAIYGIISNALADKFSNFDAFYFIANRRHSKSGEEFNSKKKIYSFLADRISKKIGAFFFEGKDEDDEVFLVTRIKVEKDGLVIEAEEARKNLI